MDVNFLAAYYSPGFVLFKLQCFQSHFSTQILIAKFGTGTKQRILGKLGNLPSGCQFNEVSCEDTATHDQKASSVPHTVEKSPQCFKALRQLTAAATSLTSFLPLAFLSLLHCQDSNLALHMMREGEERWVKE